MNIIYKQEMNTNIVSKQDWEAQVDNLRNESHKLSINITDKEWTHKIIELLQFHITNLDKSTKYAVFLSGGVDSTILLKILINMKFKFSVYTLNMGGEDIKFAKEFCLQEKIDLIEIIPSENEFTNMTKKVISLQKSCDVTTIGIALVSALLLEKVKEEYVITGLGAEEIFGGYQRHLKASNLLDECWSGLNAMYDTDLVREFIIYREHNKIPITPFLDKQLIIQGMHVPDNLKIQGSFRKYILSLVAKELGISFFERPKKAAQYGSGVQKMLEKTAKKAGFAYIKDYLKDMLNKCTNI